MECPWVCCARFCAGVTRRFQKNHVSRIFSERVPVLVDFLHLLWRYICQILLRTWKRVLFHTYWNKMTKMATHKLKIIFLQWERMKDWTGWEELWRGSLWVWEESFSTVRVSSLSGRFQVQAHSGSFLRWSFLYFSLQCSGSGFSIFSMH